MKKVLVLIFLMFSYVFATTCADGSYSSSTGKGTCSHHGGVASSSYGSYSSYTTIVTSKIKNSIVSSIVDGDTIKLENGTTCRLYGIDAPESYSNSKTTSDLEKCPILSNEMLTYGNKSKDVLTSLLENKTVTYEVIDTDSYGRNVCIVNLSNESYSINELMVRNGYATVWESYVNDTTFLSKLKNAENYANTNKLGFWNKSCNVLECIADGKSINCNNSNSTYYTSIYDNSYSSTTNNNYFNIDEANNEFVSDLKNSTQNIGWYFWMTKSGKAYLASGRDSEIAVWYLTSERKWQPIHNAGAFDGYSEASKSFGSVTISNDGRKIYFGTALNNNEFTNDLKDSNYDIGWYFWMSNSGKAYLASGRDSEIAVWYLTNDRKWQPIHNAGAFDGYSSVGKVFNSLGISSDGRTISFY